MSEKKNTMNQCNVSNELELPEMRKLILFDFILCTKIAYCHLSAQIKCYEKEGEKNEINRNTPKKPQFRINSRANKQKKNAKHLYNKT